MTPYTPTAPRVSARAAKAATSIIVSLRSAAQAPSA